MSKYIISLLFLPVFCLGQLPKALFWEISGNGLKEPSYLYGTIHMACQAKINLPLSVKNAIIQSKALLLEINFEEPVNQYKDILNSLNPKGRNIETYFNKSEIKKLDKLIQIKLKERLFNYQLLNPQAFYYLIYAISIPCKITSYEAEISKIAINNKLKLGSLETLESRQKIEQLTDLEYITAIKKFINNRKKNVFFRDFLELERMYQTKDIQKIYELSFTKNIKNGNSKKIIDDRNFAWLPIIEKSVKENKCFFAFGAAHLAGDVGIINLLKEKGYSVKPIFY
jgi:uncharacterized protein YbaP (TraB family)